MLNIRVPATSANLGPGFDTLGIALSLYNEYEVELSDTLNILNDQKGYNPIDNLFYKTYKYTTKQFNIDNEITVNFKNINIPISRGLGSSSSLIIAGIMAANELNKLKLTKKQILDIATTIEGHPDNVAPCIYGGLTINMMIDENNQKRVISNKIDIVDDIHFTVIIPNYKTNTEEARKILPKELPLPKVVENTSHALLLSNALKNNNLDNLNLFINDNIHVPYRKELIKDYDNIKELCYKNGAKGFTISGSGPTMLVISNEENFSKKIALEGEYKILDLKIDNEGARATI